MFSLEVNKEISLHLLHPLMAPELHELVDASREHLRQWLPWVVHSTTAADSANFIRHSLHDYAEGKRLVCALYCRHKKQVHEAQQSHEEQGREEQSRLAGVVSFNAIRPALGKVEMGYWLGHQWQGRGIMTRACQAMAQLAFRTYDMHKVQISVATTNHGSRAVCERLNMTLEGIITRAENVEGIVHDHAVYGLYRGSIK